MFSLFSPKHGMTGFLFHAAGNLTTIMPVIIPERSSSLIIIIIVIIPGLQMTTTLGVVVAFKVQ